MRAFAEDLKRKVSISNIVGKVVTLKPKGKGEFTGLCPFHSEKTPSFTVSEDKGFYHCFGCGAHGDSVSFRMQLSNLTYKEALESIASEAGLPVPKFSKAQNEEFDRNKIIERIFEETTRYYVYKLKNSDSEKYFFNRRLTSKTIEQYSLGHAPSNQDDLLKALRTFANDNDIIASTVFVKGQKGELYPFFRNRAMFPIKSVTGKTIAFGGRSIDGSEPKYINSPENPLFKKGHELYFLNFALRSKSDFMIVVEGYMDAISLAQHGFTNVVAPLGTALKVEQLDILWRRQLTPYLCMDNDNAGQKAAFKTAVEALPLISPQKTLKFIKLYGAKDPDEFLQKNKPDVLSKILENPTSLSDFIFSFELAKKSLKTPESKADLKSRLLQHSEQIKDNNLKKFFAQDLMSRFYNSLNNKSERTNKKNKESQTKSMHAVVSTMGYEDKNEAVIFYLLLSYPDLITHKDIWHHLENLSLNTEVLDKTHKYLLSITDNAGKYNDHELHAARSELTAHVADLNDVSAQFEIDSKEAAAAYIRRQLKLIELKNLQKELEIAAIRLSQSPSEQNFAFFTNLKNAESNLKNELGII